MQPPRPTLPIPFGWYCVGYGDDLAPGEVRTLRLFARDLVLRRTEHGEGGLASVHDPQRGALPLEERNGFIWAWYHPGGASPSFPLKTFEELDSGEWTECERREWTIATHVQETGENAVDSAHFLAVHGVPDMLARPDVRFDAHLRVSDLAMELTRISDDEGLLKGRFVEGRIVTMNSGPGQTWTRQFGVADLLIIGLPTPIEADRLLLRFACSVPRAQGERHARLSRAIIDNAIRQVEQDIPIWEHKRYLPRPVLCDGDGPIAEYRRWFARFYAE